MAHFRHLNLWKILNFLNQLNFVSESIRYHRILGFSQFVWYLGHLGAQNQFLKQKIRPQKCQFPYILYIGNMRKTPLPLCTWEAISWEIINIFSFRKKFWTPYKIFFHMSSTCIFRPLPPPITLRKDPFVLPIMAILFSADFIVSPE